MTLKDVLSQCLLQEGRRPCLVQQGSPGPEQHKALLTEYSLKHERQTLAFKEFIILEVPGTILGSADGAVSQTNLVSSWHLCWEWGERDEKARWGDKRKPRGSHRGA